MRSTVHLVKFVLCNVLVLSQGVFAKTENDVLEAPLRKDAKELIQLEKYSLKSPTRLVDGTAAVVSERTVRVVVEIPMDLVPENVQVPDQCPCSKNGSDVSEEPVLKDAKELNRVSEYSLLSPVHLVDAIDPIAGENTVRVVVEIPTGSTQKWEVEKPSGDLKWEFERGKPRVLQYLGYPGNYGMVPRTLLSQGNGGDGDPLDVLILGPPVPRGSIVEVKIIGLLKMSDKGRQDDKLIAIMAGGVFNKVESIDDLDDEFAGVTTIVETWFANYKGKKKVEIDGFASKKKANKLLTRALEDYKDRAR